MGGCDYKVVMGIAELGIGNKRKSCLTQMLALQNRISPTI